MAYRDVAVPPTSKRALETISLLSRKWHPVVIVALERRGPLGFNELLEAIPGVSSKVLSSTLEALQEAALIERRVVSDSPLRVEYELTTAGHDMQPIFEALGAWGEQYLESATPRVLLADSDRRITELYAQWLLDRYALVKAYDGEALETAFDERTDVVVVDERLPGADIGAFVSRAAEHSRTILLVGDRPDFDLLAVECDDVLRKPVVRKTVLDAVGSQLSRAGEPADSRERASLTARRSAFEEIYATERLESDEHYRDLRSRLDALTDR